MKRRCVKVFRYHRSYFVPSVARHRSLAVNSRSLDRSQHGVVIDAEVSERNALDVGLAYANRSELRPRLLLTVDVEAHAQAEVQAPARQALQGRGRARIDPTTPSRCSIG